MCGILGCFWSSKRSDDIELNIKKALLLIQHRGPDNQTLINGDNWSIAHTRLSIIDTSSIANQPFTDKNEKYYLSFNGEIYNYQTLRRRLLDEGIKFETFSDTEVLFKLLIIKGLEQTLKVIEGMFSFIFFDKVNNTVYGARDQLGQKPLHYFLKNNLFSICSEIPPLLKLNNTIEPDLTSWRTYLCSSGIISKEDTFFLDIKALPAGHCFKFNNGNLKLNKYFDVTDLHDGRKVNIQSLEKNVSVLDTIFKKSIKKHIISDVPIGVLCSGGIDSSLILKYVYDQNKKIKTYTKSSPNIETIPQKIIPKLLEDYPVKSNFIHQDKKKYLFEAANFVCHTATPARWGGGPPMAKVCQFAFSEGTKVLLSGDGVDESCAGYDSHKTLFDSFDNDFLKQHSMLDLDQNSQFFDKDLLRPFIDSNFDDRKKILNVLQNIEDKKEKFARAVLFQDVGSFLQRCNLPHSDSYSMMYSIELRNPFLDLNLLKFIMNLPISHRFNLHNSGYQSKFIFRLLAEKVIGNYLNVHKEGTRNYSIYISNPDFWNFNNFKIREFFNLKKELKGKSLFRYLNLEFLFRSVFLKEKNYLPKLLTIEGLNQNKV
jgi:asparagine synthase (glutamine-hydrolysing)